MPSAASRNDFADYLKGVLIFLTACGHLIQYVGYHGEASYYLDPLAKGNQIRLPATLAIKPSGVPRAARRWPPPTRLATSSLPVPQKICPAARPPRPSQNTWPEILGNYSL